MFNTRDQLAATWRAEGFHHVTEAVSELALKSYEAEVQQEASCPSL